ncbi:MAG: hypothetical protein F4004_06685, partial [Acidimicrobiia bacterium]|nr:hypothetical protein [Acidimicrobiia bacterium]
MRRRSLAVRVVAAAIIVAVCAPATATARTADPQPPSWPVGTTNLGDITGVVTRKFRDEALDSVNNPSDYFRFELTARRAVRLVARKLTLEADLFVEDSDHVVVASSENPGTAKELLELTLDPGVYFMRVQVSGTGAGTYRLRYQTSDPPEDATAITVKPDGGTSGQVAYKLTDPPQQPAENSDTAEADAVSEVWSATLTVGVDGGSQPSGSGYSRWA